MRRAQRVRDGDVDHVVLEARDQLKVRVSAVLKEHGSGFHLCVAAGEARDTCDNLHDLVVPVIEFPALEKFATERMFREIREVRVLGTARAPRGNTPGNRGHDPQAHLDEGVEGVVRNGQRGDNGDGIEGTSSRAPTCAEKPCAVAAREDTFEPTLCCIVCFAVDEPLHFPERLVLLRIE